MIVFVGEGPSSKNKDPDVAFVGTPSYKKILDWIYELDLDVTDVVLCNMDQVKAYPNSSNGHYVETPKLSMDIASDDIIITLGKKADKHIESLGITYRINVPHPSPRNRVYNDPMAEKVVIDRLHQYIFGDKEFSI